MCQIKTPCRKRSKPAHTSFGDLHGVIHAAGEADGKIIQARTADDEIRMCQAKINGTYVSWMKHSRMKRSTSFYFVHP
nr:KR domain-containing protein [Bacillus pumilus]